VMRTNEAFQQVAGSSAKAAELVGEITAASSEQAQGIDQINKAVTQMDTVTQKNAANAEESAAASEEMNAQAETMKDMVGELMAMVGGAAHRTVTEQGKPGKTSRQRLPKLSRTTKAVAPRKKPAADAKEVRPDQVIPFEQDDFDNF